MFSKRKFFIVDMLIIVMMGIILCSGAIWQGFRWSNDMAKYQCYAVSFWHGTSALQTLPVKAQCGFITNAHPGATSGVLTKESLVRTLKKYHVPAPFIAFAEAQPVSQPLHSLPLEYPLLTIIPFSLGLIAPTQFYQPAFTLWMAIVAGVLYVLLRMFRSRGAALAFAIYLVAGCWGTAVTRFDLIPAGLTLVALLCAERTRWNWAFVLLALATMLKFYPVLLVPPFLIAQQKTRHDAWYAHRRWHGLASYVLTCALLTMLSLLLSVQGTLGAFSYFTNRPVQVESLASSFLWLASFLGYPLHYAYTYGSLNVISRLSSLASLASNLLWAAGLLYVLWLQWRGKISLAASLMLTLLVIIVTNKVLSPQYFIWIAPFVAYEGESDWRWLVSWGSIGLLTTWIYPFFYNATPELVDIPLLPAFHPVVFARNSLLLIFVIVLLYHYSRRRPQTQRGGEQTKPVESQAAVRAT